MKKRKLLVSEKVMRAYHTICEHPGITRVALCRELGIRSQNLDGMLAGLEGTDMLITEQYGLYYKFEAKP